MTTINSLHDIAKRQICNRYKLTEDQYNELEFELGIDYLERTFDGYPGIAKEFSRSSSFWTWWKLQSAKVNVELIELDRMSYNEYRLHQQKHSLDIPRSIFKQIADQQREEVEI